MTITKKIKYYLFIASTLLLCITAIAYWKHAQHVVSKPEKQKLISVITQEPVNTSVPVFASATGYLDAIQDTVITPKVSGYIKAIPFQPGDKVTAGNTLFQLDNTKETNALAAAKANDALSRYQYNRNKNLLKKGLITQEVYYTSQVTMEQNAAALKEAQTNLNDKTITAPFSGTLGAINTSIGDYINPGTALTSLVNNDNLRVSYSLPVKYLPLIHINQPVNIISDITNNKVIGKVSFISPVIDQATQTILINAKILNANGAFKQGEFVSIKQKIKTIDNALLVPEQSVIAGIGGYSIFVAKNNIATQVPVKIGERQNGMIMIVSGINNKDNIIVSGQNQVHDGEKIKMINKDIKLAKKATANQQQL